MELADTSAWTTRHRDTNVAADFDARVLAGEIATCAVVMLELLSTARDPEEMRDLRYELSALPRVPISDAEWTRAFDVWQELADIGRHRQVSRVDLVVAAAAESVGIPVCHYDRDYEVIASVTGQPQRAIAKLGTL